MKRLTLVVAALFITLVAVAYFVLDHPWAAIPFTTLLQNVSF